MKKEGPKFTKDNYWIWIDRMKIYLKGMECQYWEHVVNMYQTPTNPLTIDQLKVEQENIQALEAIVSTLSNSEYTDVHGLEIAYELWENLKNIYGGDEHVERTKEESLRGRFDDMRMMDGDNIQQYGQRIKEIVGEIKSADGTINDDTVISKMLRTLLLVYGIRVFAIQ